MAIKFFPLTRHIRPAVLAGALGALAFTSGCVMGGGVAGAPGVTFVDGSLVAPLSAGLDQAAAAANLAVDQLGFAKIREERDAVSDTLIAQSATDKRVELQLETAGDHAATVTIRVGAFGDQALSLAILAKLKANLGP
jgi:hypothetical protein